MLYIINFRGIEHAYFFKFIKPFIQLFTKVLLIRMLAYQLKYDV